MTRILIERYAEPLSIDSRGRPQRGQLYETIFGKPGEPDITHKVGSPAPWRTVKAHEEVIRAAE